MFNLIAAHDRNFAIGKDGQLPWYFSADMKHFSRTTRSGDHNIIVMGKNTWNSIPLQNRPLPKRVNIILSSTLQISSENESNIHVCRTFDDMLNLIKNIKTKETQVWFIGGARIYSEALERGIVSKLFLTKIHGSFEGCDTFLERDNLASQFHVHSSSTITDTNISETNSDGTHVKYLLSFKELHRVTEENQYIELIQNILENGIIKKDRTGVGTQSIFGANMRFSLENGIIPLLTTKRVFWRGIVEELLWFLRGSTNVSELQKKNVHIWDGNTTRAFLDSIGLQHLEENDAGASYSFQWRHFGAKYVDCHTNYEGQGFDQVKHIIHELRHNPNSRRILLSGWNPCDLDKTCLPCCHVSYLFTVREGKLSCLLFQRSADVGCGVPFNIASASLFTHMLAHICNLKPGELVYTIGDAHIYLNHIDKLKTQCSRIPRLFPNISLSEDVNEIEDFTSDNIHLQSYTPHGKIKLAMAV